MPMWWQRFDRVGGSPAAGCGALGSDPNVSRGPGFNDRYFNHPRLRKYHIGTSALATMMASA